MACFSGLQIERTAIILLLCFLFPPVYRGRRRRLRTTKQVSNRSTSIRFLNGYGDAKLGIFISLGSLFRSWLGAAHSS